LVKEVAKRGAHKVNYITVRLNGQIGEVFSRWIRQAFPERAEKVLGLIAQTHGGQLNDNRFGDRMRGSGEYADQIRQLFHAAVRRYVRDAGDQLVRLHKLTRADSTTRNRKRAMTLQRAYDDLEKRIEKLSEEEELAAIRPDLDGKQIMEILDIPPGPVVGQAYNFLLGLRLDQGPMDEASAVEALKAWWAARPSS
jgi:tRNA nucleotidyltransferase/poly(A) polymerase